MGNILLSCVTEKSIIRRDLPAAGGRFLSATTQKCQTIGVHKTLLLQCFHSSECIKCCPANWEEKASWSIVSRRTYLCTNEWLVVGGGRNVVVVVVH